MKTIEAAQFFKNYQPIGSGYDEAMEPSGNTLRSAYHRIASHLQKVSPDELFRRWNLARRQIEEEGVTYSPHDATQESIRPWSLDPFPVALEESEWNSVVEGLQQRALLADLITLDLLGPQTLLRERIVPPDVLFANPRYFPALHTLTAATRKHVQIFAADVVRLSDGRWHAWTTRTRSPFGLGYILENRLVTSRTLPNSFRICNVHRLATFFIALRDAIQSFASRHRDNPRVVIWTKGPSSTSYPEDTLLARYLGYTLVEGGDLAVRENRVILKTLGGPLPVEVILRRVEDHLVDPVELDADSDIGVPGILEVVRSGEVAFANALGTALAEAPILQPFLPAICRHFLSEPLKLPSIPIRWCGLPDDLSECFNCLDAFQFRKAFRDGSAHVVRPRELSKEDRASFQKQLQSAPADFIAEAILTPSTVPVLVDKQWKPWYLAARTFLVATESGYEALPGGLARVSPKAELLAENLTSGERTKDLWILSPNPVEPISLLNQRSSHVELKRGGADMPSRVGDNLFWLGRYLERSEQLTRLARCLLHAIASESDQSKSAIALMRVSCEIGLVPSEAVQTDAISLRRTLTTYIPTKLLEGNENSTLLAPLRSAVQTATSVRDRISLDAIRTIRELEQLVCEQAAQLERDVPTVLTLLDSTIGSLTSLSGLASENMTRTQGWRLMDMGKRLERALYGTRILRLLMTRYLSYEEDVGSMEALLQLFDSLMTYRARYSSALYPMAVIDLIVTDETNPRSVAFQLATIQQHVDQLPRKQDQAVWTLEQRLAASVLNVVRLSEADELAQVDAKNERSALMRLLVRVGEMLPKLSDEISARFLIHTRARKYVASFGRNARP